MKKRFAALILAVLMAATVLGGCSSGKVNTSKYGTTVVAMFGEQSIYLDELNYYLRTAQYEWEVGGVLSSNGVSKWDQEINFYNILVYTLAESLIERSVTGLRQIYVLCEQAEKQGIALDAEDEAKVSAAVEAFLADSDEELLSYVNLSAERLTEIYRRNALANKVYAALAAETDTTVTDEEALQYDISYVYVTTSALSSVEDLAEDTTPESVAAEVVEAVNGGTAFADAVEKYGLKVTTATAGTADTSYYAQAVSGLAVGEAGSMAYGSDGAYCVAVRDSERNDEATETKREELEQEKIDEHFAEVYAEWEASSAEFDPEYKMINALPVSEPIYKGSSNE